MATDATGAKPDEHYEGMPQLDPEWFSNQIFWLILTLIALFFILTRVALPRIAGVLQDRAGTIQRDLDMAEEMKRKAEEAEAAYEQALTDARAEAQKIVEATKAEIQADLDAATAKADAEISAKAAESEKAIAAIRDGAMASVEEVANATAIDIVEAILPGAGDEKALSAAIKTQLKG